MSKKSANTVLFNYLHQKKGAFYFPILASIANKIFDLMPPILVAWVIDAITLNPPSWLITCFPAVETDAWLAVIILGIATLVIFAGESIFQWAYEFGFQRLAQKVQHDLRTEAYSQLQKKQLSFFENNRTGNLMSVVNDDVNQLERFLNDGLNQILQIITLFLFAGVVLFATEPFLASIGLLPIPLIFIGSMYYQKLIAPHYQTIRESVGNLASRLENNISGMLVIKSFTAEQHEEKRLGDTSLNYLKANDKAIRISTLYVPLIRMLIALGFTAVILIGGYQIIHESSALTYGGFTMFAMMIQRMLWPITRFGVIFNDYERAMASVRRIFNLINEASDKEKKPGDELRFKDKQAFAIDFNGVSFGYQSNMPILKNINLHIPARSTIGIVGATGAGKTTLIKLLLRLYDIQDGILRIGGQNIKDLDHQYLRKHIALVSQDVYLFHGSILENLKYGGEYDFEEVVKYTKMVGMHDFILSQPQQYHSMVGERGIKLSGGQRQRLSIVRALLKQAPVILFDEATSAVDVETEGYLQQHLERLTQQCTTVLVAHRLSTVKNCSKIVVMDQGKIVEEGVHDDLVAQNGVYAKLWAIQTGSLSKKHSVTQ